MGSRVPWTPGLLWPCTSPRPFATWLGATAALWALLWLPLLTLQGSLGIDLAAVFVALSALATVCYGMRMQALRRRGLDEDVPGTIFSAAVGSLTVLLVTWVLVLVLARPFGTVSALVALTFYGLLVSVFLAAVGALVLAGLISLGRLVAQLLVALYDLTGDGRRSPRH